MEGLHARPVGEGRAVVGGTTEQVCSVAYLLLNFGHDVLWTMVIAQSECVIL